MRLKTRYNVRISFKGIILFDHFVKKFKTKNLEQIKYFRNLNEETTTRTTTTTTKLQQQLHQTQQQHRYNRNKICVRTEIN